MDWNDSDAKFGRRQALVAAAASVASVAVVSTMGPGLAQAAPAPSPPPPDTPQGATVDRPLRDIRDYPVAFHREDIGPGTGPVSVISRPRFVFRSARLVMPVKVASAFRLIAIRVGKTWQRASIDVDLRDAVAQLTSSLPYRAPSGPSYALNAINVWMPMDVALASQNIEMLVENITSEKQTFMACLFGVAAH